MIVRTRFGTMDAEGLKELKSSFDAAEILRAVEKVETMRRDIDAVRDRLLRLHDLTKYLMADEE